MNEYQFLRVPCQIRMIKKIHMSQWHRQKDRIWLGHHFVSVSFTKIQIYRYYMPGPESVDSYIYVLCVSHFTTVTQRSWYMTVIDWCSLIIVDYNGGLCVLIMPDISHSLLARQNAIRNNLRIYMYCAAYWNYTFHIGHWGQLRRSFWWFLEPSSAQLEIEPFVFMLRRCGMDCLSMLNPVHHCLLLEILLKHTFSSALFHPFKVCHIAVESPHLCTAHFSIFKMEIALYECQFYLLLLLVSVDVLIGVLSRILDITTILVYR